MRIAISVLLLSIALSAGATNRDLSLAREMLEDAIVRDDADGMNLVRDRILRIAAGSSDRGVQRDAHYLVALSDLYESFSAYRDAASAARLAADGIRHADRAIEIDPQFADAWILSSTLRFNASRMGKPAPPDPPGAPNRYARALELNAKSPGVALWNGIIRSFNPDGAAKPEGVQILDDLASRLDADRAATGRRFGLWDAQAHGWRILVRMASDEPNIETLRTLSNRLREQRPDFGLGDVIAEAATERRFVAAPTAGWQPFLSDASGDGKRSDLPDVVRVDRTEDPDRLWYRVTFREPLKRSFGVNVVVNRTGSPATGMAWWGKDSTFRFDRLVTAWVTRDGDRYFGRVGVTDEEGARGARLAKITGDVVLALGDENSIVVGVPRDALALTDASIVIAAGGSHLVWNDDASTPVVQNKSR